MFFVIGLISFRSSLNSDKNMSSDQLYKRKDIEVLKMTLFAGFDGHTTV